jgi:hypothetical protein
MPNGNEEHKGSATQTRVSYLYDARGNVVSK